MNAQLQESLFADVDAHMDRYTQELCEFLRIPSVSTDPDNTAGMREAAVWLLSRLKELGFEGALTPTEGWPLVIARCEAHPGAPRILIYGHYDVQPEAPLEEWVTPPFEPALREGAVYARGANDDKGQIYTYVKALETWRRITGDIPVNVLFVAEGEEEVGSGSLLRLMREQPALFAADAFLMSDSSMLGRDAPAITCGFRGIAAMELSVRTMARDLHSGLFGGVASNAAEVLTGLLASLKDAGGRVAVPGFYDGVLPLSPREKADMASIPYDETAAARALGMETLGGEQAFPAMERKSARPTLDINGMWSGYTGTGSKTVIPAAAHAKLSARLVPGQEPHRIFERIAAHLREQLPPDARMELRYQFGAMPVGVDADDPNLLKAERAIEAGFGRRPVRIRSGGNVHIVSEIRDTLGIPSSLILGWGRPENGSHSPNECFYLDDFKNAVRSLCVLLGALAEEAGEGETLS